MEDRTIDAIGCQRAIATTIRARGADSLLALKANRPALAEEVRLFSEQEADSAVDQFEACDGDHGRVDLRRHWVSHDVAKVRRKTLAWDDDCLAKTITQAHT